MRRAGYIVLAIYAWSLLVGFSFIIDSSPPAAVTESSENTRAESRQIVLLLYSGFFNKLVCRSATGLLALCESSAI